MRSMRNLWSIIEQLVEAGVSEDYFADELSRRYETLDGRKGSLFYLEKAAHGG